MRPAGPREKKFEERAAEKGYARASVLFDGHVVEKARLADALEEALDGWEYAASYKGDYLRNKHGDAEDIARLRALLAEADEAAGRSP